MRSISSLSRPGTRSTRSKSSPFRRNAVSTPSPDATAAGRGGPASRGLHLGRLVQPELLDRLVAQLELLDLARDRHREVADHDDVPGHLVVGDPAPAELAQRLGVQVDALA